MSIDIAKVVKSCGQARVKKISVEGDKVEIEFFDKEPPRKATRPQRIRLDEETPTPSLDPLAISHDFKKLEVAEQIDEDFETMPLSDPEKYEELMSSGKLNEYGEKEYAEA